MIKQSYNVRWLTLWHKPGCCKTSRHEIYDVFKETPGQYPKKQEKIRQQKKWWNNEVTLRVLSTQTWLHQCQCNQYSFVVLSCQTTTRPCANFTLTNVLKNRKGDLIWQQTYLNYISSGQGTRVINQWSFVTLITLLWPKDKYKRLTLLTEI